MHTTALPRVALVGRPNVGKSTLFNRLIGKRQAVVADVAGTTRDRLDQTVSWSGRSFILTDMAGLEVSLRNDTEISRGMQAQVAHALQAADLIVWVVDGAAGATRADQQIHLLLQGLHKPLVIAVNKCDHDKHEVNQYEFARFAHDRLVALSALHGRGSEALLDAIAALLSATPVTAAEPDERELRVSIAGRPNVGKSTLLNALVGEDRSLVSGQAGTTRDAVDTLIPAEQLFGPTFTKWKQVRIVDTAGIRRRGKVEHGVEGWSVIRSLEAVDASEVVLLMLDASEGLVHQDLQIVQQVVDAGRAMVLLLNKWDQVLEGEGALPGTSEDAALQERYLDRLRREAPFLHWIQVIFLSAKRRINLHVLGRLVLRAYQAWDLQVEQVDLDELAAVLRQEPLLRNLKGITFEHGRPPVFHLQVEGRSLPHFSTVRYVENALRDYLQIGPTVIKIWSQPTHPRRRGA